MEEELKTDSQDIKQYEWLRPWQFKPGQTGNAGGRPKGGFSLKTYVKQMLEDMPDEDKLEFLRGVDKKVLWEMAEGKPKQDVELSGEVKSKIVKLDE